jgi:hypothetical protein
MDDRRTINMALAQGERRQVLVEAGSTVLALAGRVALGEAMAWLAEHAVAHECRLEAEQAWVAERGGWVDLAALATARIIVLPPDTVSIWQQVGRCLEAIFGAAPTGKLRQQR